MSRTVTIRRVEESYAKIDAGKRIDGAIEYMHSLGSIGIKAYALLTEFARSHGLQMLDAIIAATAIQAGCMA